MHRSHILDRSLLIAAVVLSALLALALTAEAAVRNVEAEGTALKVTMTDGKVLHSPGLVGAVVGIAMQGKVHRVRIDGVERDPMDSRENPGAGEAVWLHDLSLQTADGSWVNPCMPGPDGRAQGFFIAGRSSPGGMMQPAEPGTLELVCTAGGQAKCVRFGYRPWETTPAGASMLDTHRACVRMLRGDYAGTDAPKTRDGTQVDVFDAHGIWPPENDKGLVFEAGWGPDGAVCVHHPRIKENVSLEELETTVPKLKGRTGAVCTEEFARRHGALIFNSSKP